MPKKYDFTDEFAAASPEHNLDAPIHVVLGEAEDVAAFAQNFWDPVAEDNDEGEEPRPGLASLAKGSGPKTLSKSIIGEIRQLIEHARGAHTQAVLTTLPRKDSSKVERGQELLSEMRAILEYVFDDGLLDENDEKLSALKAEHADVPDGTDELALALEQYGTLADQHRDALDGLADFQAAHIDEAFALAKELRAAPSGGPGNATSERATAYRQRNRYLNLLQERVRKVRSGARLVFRHHPEIARLATSAHARKQRAEARREKRRRDEEEKKKPQ